MPPPEPAAGQSRKPTKGTRPLPVDHPSLLAAKKRLRRILVAWALLFAGVGALTAFAQRDALARTPMLWFAAAGMLLLSSSPQPAYLALVAALWGLSLVSLNAQVNQVLSADPIPLIFGGGFLEQLASAFVRVIFVIMAWNQFLFYRMLYGTEGAPGLDPKLRPVPEVTSNWTDSLAIAALGMAGVSLVAVGFGYSPIPLGSARILLIQSASLASLAIGLGLGAAFSPTRRRVAALAGIALGSAGYLLVLLSGNLLS